MSNQQAITEMFDNISMHYDFLNHLLSLNIDKLWRRRIAKTVAGFHPARILDVATGTADLAIRLAKDNPEAHITGIDLSEQMLRIGQEKVKKAGLESRIQLRQADAMSIPYSDSSFDAVTVAFGVRNFGNMRQGLEEIHRVVKDDGTVNILEFSLPGRFPVKQVYSLYFNHLLPKIGQVVSKNASAYRYLPKSVQQFPKPSDFIQLMEEAGLFDIQVITFSGGIATGYCGLKMKSPSTSQ